MKQVIVEIFTIFTVQITVKYCSCFSSSSSSTGYARPTPSAPPEEHDDDGDTEIKRVASNSDSSSDLLSCVVCMQNTRLGFRLSEGIFLYKKFLTQFFE